MSPQTGLAFSYLGCESGNRPLDRLDKLRLAGPVKRDQLQTRVRVEDMPSLLAGRGNCAS